MLFNDDLWFVCRIAKIVVKNVGEEDAPILNGKRGFCREIEKREGGAGDSDNADGGTVPIRLFKAFRVVVPVTEVLEERGWENPVSDGKENERPRFVSLSCRLIVA